MRKTLSSLAAAGVVPLALTVLGPAVPAAQAVESRVEARAPLTSPTPAPREAACHAPDRPFRPTAVSVPRLLRPTRILPVGRDAAGRPLPPPLTPAGKRRFSWDRESRVLAGSPQGVVRLLAHTYPGGADAALGNRLLPALRVGSRLVVTGPHGARLCYRVRREVSVPAGRPVPAYYDDTSKPTLAIAVCSGVRRGPGDWSHRTVWYATPVTR